MENTEVLWFIVILTTILMTICVSYHQPKPLYDMSNFETLVADNISCLLNNELNSIFILTVDLNKLNTTELQLQLQQGLEQIANSTNTR